MRIRTLSGIFAFLVAAGLLLWPLHWAVDTGMRRIRFGLYGAFNRAAEGKLNADIVVTGSSRAVLHYDPVILGRAVGLSAFNLGRVGALTNVHTGILRFYLHHNRRPRLLIENVDFYSLTNNGSLYDLAEYTPYLYDPGLYEAMRIRYPWIWKARYLPLYGYIANDLEFRHYLGLEALFGIQPLEDYKDGYKPSPSKWTKAFVPPADPQVFDLDPHGKQDFEDFLAEAESRGIPTILVLSPAYYEYLAIVIRRPQLLATFAELARRHGAEFWDMSDLEPISSSKPYFADSLHLNQTGASAFSEVLGQRLAAWLAGPRAARNPQPGESASLYDKQSSNRINFGYSTNSTTFLSKTISKK